MSEVKKNKKRLTPVHSAFDLEKTKYHLWKSVKIDMQEYI